MFSGLFPVRHVAGAPLTGPGPGPGRPLLSSLPPPFPSPSPSPSMLDPGVDSVLNSLPLPLSPLHQRGYSSPTPPPSPSTPTASFCQLHFTFSFIFNSLATLLPNHREGACITPTPGRVGFFFSKFSVCEVFFCRQVRGVYGTHLALQRGPLPVYQGGDQPPLQNHPSLFFHLKNALEGNIHGAEPAVLKVILRPT